MDDQTAEQRTLHDLRKEIDRIIQLIEGTKVSDNFKPAAREISLSYTHAQEAKMWLGQALGKMGSAMPAGLADKAE